MLTRGLTCTHAAQKMQPFPGKSLVRQWKDLQSFAWFSMCSGLPVHSREQAVLPKEGQEIVGIGLSPQPEPRPEESSFQGTVRLHAPRAGKRKPSGNGRTMKKWTWQCCVAISLGGNPKLCCTQVFVQLIDKKRPSSHSNFSHTAAYVVYLDYSCRTVSSDLHVACLCFLISADVTWL